MKPGRELDALVAEKVMGERATLESVKDQKEYERVRQEIEFCSPYSTDIAAAWEVVEKEADGHWMWFELEWAGRRWKATFRGTSQGNAHSYIAHAPTAPHAICLAALKAVGYNP